MRGDIPLSVREVFVAHGSDEAPVIADRATLEPQPAKADCFERHARDPDRCEEVAFTAAHDEVTAEVVPASASDDCAADDDNDNDYHWNDRDQPSGRHMPVSLGSDADPISADRLAEHHDRDQAICASERRL